MRTANDRGSNSAGRPGDGKKTLVICPTCQGHRIEKVAYNHMVLDRTCSKCDGEGVLQATEKQAQAASIKHIASVQSA